MLTELRISGLGVIGEANLEPCPGMTVVTGETGAGKTMIVTGLGLLLGGRADSGAVRNGANKAVVEGRFTGLDAITARLEEIGADMDDDELLVCRQVTQAGRSRAMVGGLQVPLGRLAELTGELATIHGQSEQLRLGTPERQREVLDRAGGMALAGILSRYRELFDQRRALRSELAELLGNAQSRAREADLLSFGLNEIDAVDPQPGEDVELAAQAARLQAVDDLRQLALRADQAISGSAEGDLDDPGAVGLLGLARKALDQTAALDPGAAELAALVREASYAVNDVAAQVAGYLADLEADPVRLEAIAARRARLQDLTRKYGSTVDEVLGWSRASALRLGELSSGDDRIGQLRPRLDQLDRALGDLALELTELRQRAADRLQQAVQTELAALAMSRARLRFTLSPLPELGPWGGDQVQLLFAANAGADLAPLAKVASGGELSRVRLALEVVLAGSDPGHTFVFDEVDAGVGGAVAVEIGRRLARLADQSQVIVVTHLAQVAAFADRHFVVSKSDDGEVTTSGIHRLAPAERESELARMMAGLGESRAGLAHARELLVEAGQAPRP